jgi:hypothetical protein
VVSRIACMTFTADPVYSIHQVVADSLDCSRAGIRY